MPDENVTGATRSEAPRSHDVLFGDAPEETAAAVAEDPDSKEHDANDANGRPTRAGKSRRPVKIRPTLRRRLTHRRS